MKKVYTVVAIILALIALFIYLYPQLSEKKKVNDRCQKARDAKAQKAQERREEQQIDTINDGCTIIENNENEL